MKSRIFRKFGPTVLGLQHSNDKNSIMWGYSNHDPTSLNQNDIEAIQALYGKPIGGYHGLGQTTASEATS